MPVRLCCRRRSRAFFAVPLALRVHAGLDGEVKEGEVQTLPSQGIIRHYHHKLLEEIIIRKSALHGSLVAGCALVSLGCVERAKAR